MALATESIAGRSLGALRRRLLLESLALAVSPVGFGLTFGLAAKAAGLTLGASLAMSAFVMAGAAQFSSLILLVQGTHWAVIVGLTAMINLRNLVFAAALAPWLTKTSLRQRAAMAQILADETFALALAHFRRVGRVDIGGYWITGVTSVGWVLATGVGYMAASLVPDPSVLGLDAVFPSAMACLTILLIDAKSAALTTTFAAAAGVALGLLLPPGLPVVAAALVAVLLTPVAKRLAG
jgi:predicted branched-subunit amino acid permease